MEGLRRDFTHRLSLKLSVHCEQQNLTFTFTLDLNESHGLQEKAWYISYTVSFKSWKTSKKKKTWKKYIDGKEKVIMNDKMKNDTTVNLWSGQS